MKKERKAMLERERSFMKPEAVATAVLAFALTVLVACSSAPVGAPPATRHDPGMPASTTASDPASQGGQRSVGYLTPEMTPDAVDIIPPAPKEGEPRNDADWAIFRATPRPRKLGSGPLEAGSRGRQLQAGRPAEGLHGSTEFMADMAKAREELATARKSGPKPDASACAKEFELTKPLAVP